VWKTAAAAAMLVVMEIVLDAACHSRRDGDVQEDVSATDDAAPGRLASSHRRHC